ncbi:MAG TPA: hypothetical protein VFA59_03590 [Vicinamibacterales bacterium]|nr:hypothetical protein [Vicinamibacterales bacterium]
MKKLFGLTTVGLALCLTVSPAEAKHKSKIKAVVGCVHGSGEPIRRA